jgi:hypothetical protein
MTLLNQTINSSAVSRPTQTIARLKAQRNQTTGQIFRISFHLRVSLTDCLKGNNVSHLIGQRFCSEVDEPRQSGGQIRNIGGDMDVALGQLSRRSAAVLFWVIDLKKSEEKNP